MKKGTTDSSAPGGAPGEKTEFSLIPAATLETLYRNLLRGRMLESRMRRGKNVRDAGWDAVRAATAAVLQDMAPVDLLVSSDENPAARLLDGQKAATVIREREPQADAAQRLLHAVGTALTSRTKKDGKVSVVFWREAEQELWRDVLEMARAYTLPLVLVCPVSEPLKDTRGLEPGTELPRIIVDGYDAVATYRVAHEAIDRARRNRGASLIECASFRVKGHRHGDAIVNMERYLRGKGLLRRGMRRKIEAEFAEELRPQLAVGRIRR